MTPLKRKIYDTLTGIRFVDVTKDELSESLIEVINQIMYSKDDLEEAFYEGREDELTFTEWFEQFKKKQAIIDMMNADEELGLYENTYKSGLEYLISEILYEQEIYFDDEGELIDKPRIQYMNGLKSHVDLTKYVEKAREIDKKIIQKNKIIK